MKRLLCVLFVLLSLIGCNEKTEEIEVPQYRDTHELAFGKVIPDMNAALTSLASAEEELYVSFDSFNSPYLLLCQRLCEEDAQLQTIQESLRQLDSAATIEKPSPNQYKISFNQNGKQIDIVCNFKSETEAIRCVRYIDGSISEFFEFIPLDANRYAIQNEDGRALVTYEGEGIARVVVGRMKSSLSVDPDLYSSDIRLLDANTDSAFESTTLDDSWILAKKDDMMQLAIFENNQLTLQLCTCSYEIDEKRENLGRKWQWQDEIVIQAP